MPKIYLTGTIVANGSFIPLIWCSLELIQKKSKKHQDQKQR